MALSNHVYERPARKHLGSWRNWAAARRLQAIIAVGRMLKCRFDNVLTYPRYRTTNAASDSINPKIQRVGHTARGFRNLRNIIYAIHFYCGGLDPVPATHQSGGKAKQPRQTLLLSSRGSPRVKTSTPRRSPTLNQQKRRFTT